MTDVSGSSVISSTLEAPSVDFEVVADEPGLRRLEPEWCDLFERARRRNYYQTFNWILRSWEHITRCRGHELFVIVGRQAGRVVLIWPLARRRHLLWRAAEFIGAENAYLQDVLVEDAPDAGKWLEAAWSYVTNRLDFLWLNRLRDDALLVPYLRRVEGAKVDVEAAPYIDWSDFPDWETYMKRSRNLRSDLVRRGRRLAEQGAVAFDVLTSMPEIEKTLDWVLEQKAAWMRSKGLRMREGGVDTAGTQEFFHAVVADAHASGNLRFATLTLDGKLLAADLGWVFQGNFSYEIGAYDTAWDKYAPAKLLIADLLRWTLENGFAIVDFMPIGQAYKYVWASREASPTTYLVPCSPWGRVLVAWRRSRLGATARSLLRLRPADVPRILSKRLSRRSRAPKPKQPAKV